MKAARIHAYGGPDELRVEEAPRPRPGPRDLLVEVHASSVNPIDCKLRGGAMRGLLRYPLPLVLGFDLSGVVVEVGARCSRFQPGDAVYASPDQRRIGTYAEFALVDERHAALKPPSLSHTQAAGVPLAALTAWDCLKPLRAGQRVLILAGSGGVGTFAIQLAKERGAEVLTTCSARNEQLVRELGADQVLDYTQHAFEDVLSGVDLVLDALGRWSACRRVLRRGGHLRTIVSGLPEATQRWGPYLGPLSVGLHMLGFKLSSLVAGVKVKNVLREASGEALAELTARIEAGTLRPVVERVFPLDEVVAAHRLSESGRARGKLVIAVRGEPGE
ncbi:MAG: NADP-dependent oxidoreductase [Planctomycetes bacterium]|nr:NADP-dependent oxidoreductase [Planctomycetota bacterium]